MEILTRILELLDERNLDQRELCAYLKLAPAVFSDWKAGRSKSYLKYLPQIAIYFDVSVDYLLGTTNNRTPPEKSTEPVKNEIHIIGRNGTSSKRTLTDEDFEKVIKLLDLVVPDDSGDL